MAASTKTAPSKNEAQNPLILRSHRLMEAFTKSDDERDFYLDRREGFILFVDLDKTEEELHTLEKELKANAERYCLIPKLTFYETKKIMESFVNEKVYDIDTKEKLLDIIQSKEARENFLEFIYDLHAELEKWQQFYQERSRIRIIEWLRNNHFHFVFEEDLDFLPGLIEKVKKGLFDDKVGKDIQLARKALFTKAKTYYSLEALNPRPKRGRPPKQVAKLEVETKVSTDIYTTVPKAASPFLFIPDISSLSAVTFSSKFDTEEKFLAHRRHHLTSAENDINDMQQKLASLRHLSARWLEKEPEAEEGDFSLDEDEDEDGEEVKKTPKKKAKTEKKASPKKAAAKPKKKPPAKPAKRK